MKISSKTRANGRGETVSEAQVFGRKAHSTAFSKLPEELGRMRPEER